MRVTKKLIKHVRYMFGYHGGVGEVPCDDAIKAIVIGAKEFQSIERIKDDRTAIR